jgi:hypothetical protein
MTRWGKDRQGVKALVVLLPVAKNSGYSITDPSREKNPILIFNEKLESIKSKLPYLGI